MLPINIDPILQITKKAGEIIMDFYQKGAEIDVKSDKSPVTEADIAANTYIETELAKHYPEITIIAEESFADHGIASETLKNKAFFLVDPLDGTKSFIRRKGEFTVNIGLIVNQKSVAGTILSPISGALYYTGNNGKAYKQINDAAPTEISVRTPGNDGLDFIVSHSHYDPKIDDFMKAYKVRNKMSGSSSIKFCMVAEGLADIYPRFGRTMEWDTAAGHAILLAAGGTVKTPDGADFLYAKSGFENGNFIASGDIK